MSQDRILIVSHGHPDLNAGGGEIAAYAHWKELRRKGVEAMFLARTALPSGHFGTPFSVRSTDGREVLFHAPPVDHFRHSQPHRRVVYEDFQALLKSFRPTAVHFHHYAHLGLELVRQARFYSEDMPILMTLHDYLGMCNAQGQMLKTNGSLCQRATPLDCHACFPERSPQDFFLRELFVKSFFSLVDRFICPSEFLRDRYVEWGLPAERMAVLENGQEGLVDDVKSGQGTGSSAEDLGIDQSSGRHRRFAVLGQLSDLKGTQVVLEAIRALPTPLRDEVRIEIHGSMWHADESFVRRFKHAEEELRPTMTYCGPYLHEHVGSILRDVDWVIVPSIWWENSPLVIQEAFAAGLPVICSNIGGMAEKIRHGLNGLHFRVGNPMDLARRIEEATSIPGLWKRLRRSVPAPINIQETVAHQLAIYRAGRAAALPSVPAQILSTRA